MENLESLGDYIAAQKLELAAKSIQHLMKIQTEQGALENIVASLRHSLNEARAGNSDDFGLMLANQSNVLDATFLYFVDRANGAGPWMSDHINLALKAQRQVERSIRTWRIISEAKKNQRTK